MGLCESKIDSAITPTEVDKGNDIFSYKLYKELNLSKDDTDKMRNYFNKIDIDRSGEIAASEFMKYFCMSHSQFHIRLFMLFDFDKSGAMDFVEFVAAMWNFLTLDRFHLPSYVYFIFDEKRTNKMDQKQVRWMIETVYDTDLGRNQELEGHFRGICSGRSAVTMKHFCEYCTTHVAMFSPLEKLQEELRKKVVGVHFWKSCVNSRLGCPQQLEMSYITDLHEDITHKKKKYQEKGNFKSSGSQESPGKKKQKKGPNKTDLTKQNSILAGFQNMQKRMSEDETDAKKSHNKKSKR